MAKTLPLAQQQPLHVLFKANLLEEVELGCQAAPFESRLFTIFKSIPPALVSKQQVERIERKVVTVKYC